MVMMQQWSVITVKDKLGWSPKAVFRTRPLVSLKVKKKKKIIFILLYADETITIIAELSNSV